MISGGRSPHSLSPPLLVSSFAVPLHYCCDGRFVCGSYGHALSDGRRIHFWCAACSKLTFESFDYSDSFLIFRTTLNL